MTRALLWTTAILAPGGFVLLPMLAGEALMARRTDGLPSPAEPESDGLGDDPAE